MCSRIAIWLRLSWPLKIEPIESNQATLFIYEKKLHFELYALSSPFFLIWYRFFLFNSLCVFCADETSLNISACCSCAKGEQRINAFHISLFLNSFFVFLSLILHFFSILFFGVVHFTFNCVSKSTLSHCVRVCKCAIFKRSDGACKHSIISSIQSSARALRTSSRLHIHCLLPLIVHG